MGLPLNKGDAVVLETWSVNAGVVRAAINIRPRDGTAPFNMTIDNTPNTDRSNSLTVAQFPCDGDIESALVTQISGTTVNNPGELFVQLFAGHGAGVPGSNSMMLIQDYLHVGHNPGFPNHKPIGSREGPGRIRQIQTADPAANAEIAAQTVPTGAMWRLRMATVQLVQGATQTPLPTLRFTQQSGSFISGQIPITTTALAAASTAQLTWGRGLVQSSFVAVIGDEFHTAPLPEFDMVATDNFATLTDGIGANTNYGVMSYIVEEFIVTL